MSQECPRCRLISPPSAMRCDCGYDFASGTMKASYQVANEARKPDGGTIGRQAQSDVATGIATLAVSGGISLVTYLLTGRLGAAVLPLIGGSVLYTRGRRQQRLLQQVRERELKPGRSGESDGR